MGLTTEILFSVFWLMIEKFNEEKLVSVANWRKKGFFVIWRFVTSTFVTSVYGNLEIVSILMFRVFSETSLFDVNLAQLN